jgi:hypothetical protein
MSVMQIMPGLLAQMGGGAAPPPPPAPSLVTRSAEGGSLAFNTRTYYAQFGGSEDWALGTGDFTIEWWQWMLTGIQFPRPFSVGSYPSASVAVSIENGSLYYWANGGVVAGAAITNYQNQWVHFAISRQSNLTRFFQNGVEIGSIADNNNITDSSTTLTIGNENNITEVAGFLGYMTNFRWTKGEALYITNFSVPFTPLAAGANTKLLLLAADQANLFTDSSSQHSVTNTDLVWAGVGPYSERNFLDAGNSASYLSPSVTWYDLTTFNNDVTLANFTYNASVGGHIDFGLTGSGQFVSNPGGINQNKLPSAAITMWANITNSTYFNFVAGLRGSIDFEFYFLMLDDTNQTEARVVTNAGSWDINANYTSHYGYWRHICFTVNGDKSELYINGNLVGSNTNITGTWGTSPEYFMLAQEYGGGNSSQFLKMATFRYHTRSRTSAEILAEFDAEKSRFGL